jgi:hypothetical protein
MKQPLDHLRSLKKPQRKTVYIAADNALAEEVQDIEEEVRRLRMLANAGSVADAQERLDVKEAELNTKRDELRHDALKFTFQSVSRTAYDALISDNPPTDAQREEAGDQGADLPFNPEVFPVELVIACMVDPAIDRSNPDEVLELRDWLTSEAWNQSELMQLFNACLSVNTTSRVVHMGKD